MVVPLVLERGEEGFGYSIVVAASGSPHGEPHVVRLSRRRTLSLCTGCLGCLEYGPFGHVSARIYHLQGKDDKPCPHVGPVCFSPPPCVYRSCATARYIKPAVVLR